MGFDILTGEKLNIDKHLQQIMDIDAIVYGGIDSGFVGKIENLRARYLKNKDSFVCLAENDNIVGYINYFPVCDKLFHQLIGPVRFGIDMSKDDLEEYKEDSDGKFFYELLEDEDEGKKKKEEKYFVELPGFDDEDGYFTEYSEFEKVREYFLEKIGEDALDEKTGEVMKYRLKYPESSLQELSEIMTLEIGKNITKSGKTAKVTLKCKNKSETIYFTVTQ